VAAIDESGERIAAIRLLALTGARLSEIANLTHARPNRDHRQQQPTVQAEASTFPGYLGAMMNWPSRRRC
jgi:hypothetical protein